MAGSLRIPVGAMRGAASAGEFDGKPGSLLGVPWEHGEQQWRTGFRLQAAKSEKNSRQAAIAPDPDRWVRTISKVARGNA